MSSDINLLLAHTRLGYEHQVTEINLSYFVTMWILG